jgi:hypothetical protein
VRNPTNGVFISMPKGDLVRYGRSRLPEDVRGAAFLVRRGLEVPRLPGPAALGEEGAIYKQVGMIVVPPVVKASS